MAAFNEFDVLGENIAEKVHNFAAAGDLLKVMLTNTAPVVTNTVKANITEISAGNGYTAGGDAVTNDTSRSGAVTSVTGVDVIFTASGGTIGPFRYVVLYNDTPASPLDPLIGWWDHGSAVTLNDGETFTVDFGTSLFTVTS